jgi:hypothetical protein
MSTDDTRKVKRKLSALTKSLDDLETSLAPLLSQSLPDLVLGLDTIQQAKLQVVVPYLVYDLVFGPSQKPPSPHAYPPTAIAYSLPEDKGSRPENTPSNCGARAFIFPPLVIMRRQKQLRSPRRTEYDNISIKLRMPRIPPNVRVFA